MKRTSKPLTIFVFLAVVLFAVPSAHVSAVTAGTTDSGNGGFCVRVATLMSTNEANLEAHVASMQSNFSARMTQLAADQQNIDQKVATARTEAKAQFEQKITAMEAKTGLTAAQKQAIETFKANMEKAESTRETAVDQARETYRTNLADTISGQQTSLQSSVATYQAAIKSAFSTAAASCGDGQALTTLRASVKTARQALETARNADKVGATIKSLAETRRTAVQAANQAFVTAVQQYTQDLTAALAATTTSSSTTN